MSTGYSMEELDISGFDISNVTDMTSMFGNAGMKKIYLNKDWTFDGINTTDMFLYCKAEKCYK